jgi:phosphohistidine phosphatase
MSVKLFLLRHGVAEERSARWNEMDRPLTPEGIEKMREEARGIAFLSPGIDLILSSPLKRALQTAEAVGLALRLPVVPFGALASGAAPDAVLAALAPHAGKTGILLAGHEPDLGDLAARLLGAPEGTVEFKKGALCCIEVDGLPPQRQGLLRSHLPPAVLRALGR